jgi:hypothetical protein
MNIGKSIGSVGSFKGSQTPKAGLVACKNVGLAGIKVLPNLEALALQIPAIGRTSRLAIYQAARSGRGARISGSAKRRACRGISVVWIGTIPGLENETLPRNQRQTCSKWQEIRLCRGRVE